MKRIAAVLASLAATVILSGCAHTAHAPSAERCRHETIGHTTRTECESRRGNVVTYTFTETQTWRV